MRGIFSISPLRRIEVGPKTGSDTALGGRKQNVVRIPGLFLRRVARVLDLMDLLTPISRLLNSTGYFFFRLLFIQSKGSDNINVAKVQRMALQTLSSTDSSSRTLCILGPSLPCYIPVF
jgi:hypothetical protein